LFFVLFDFYGLFLFYFKKGDIEDSEKILFFFQWYGLLCATIGPIVQVEFTRIKSHLETSSGNRTNRSEKIQKIATRLDIIETSSLHRQIETTKSPNIKLPSIERGYDRSIQNNA